MNDFEQAIGFFERALDNCVTVAKKPFMTALSALREKQDQQNPQPLTLDQLRERINKPIWIRWFGKYVGREDGWMIWKSSRPGTIFDGSDLADRYGDGWFAYDHPKYHNCDGSKLVKD
jgi:hypothetical protein